MFEIGHFLGILLLSRESKNTFQPVSRQYLHTCQPSRNFRDSPGN